MELDVPANSWAAARRPDGGAGTLMLVAEGKHGFRGSGDAIALALLRSSHDPDPYPELGVHDMRFSICLAANDSSNQELIELAQDMAHPLAVLAGTAHAGTATAFWSLFARERGTVAVSAVKHPEDTTGGKELIVRVYETEGQETMVDLGFARPVERAWLVDLNEHPISGQVLTDGGHVCFPLGGYRVTGVRVQFT